MKEVNRFWPFMKADYKAAEAYLEAQSRRGLHIQSIGSYGILATYEKAEPKNLKYAIDYFSGGYEEQENYKVMAADAGWNYVGNFDAYMIFSSEEGSQPIPLHTDWKEEYKLMRKGLWNYEMPLGIIAAIMLAVLWPPAEPVNLITMDQKISGFCLLSMYGFALTGLVHGLIVYWKTAVAIRRNTPMGTVSTRRAKGFGMVHTAFGAGVMVGTFLRVCLILQDCIATGNTGPIAFFAIWIISTLALYIEGKLPENLLPKKVGLMLTVLLVMLIIAGAIGFVITAVSSL